MKTKKNKLKCYLKAAGKDILNALGVILFMASLAGGCLLWIMLWFKIGCYIDPSQDFACVITTVIGVVVVPFVIIMITCWIQSIKERCDKND